MHSAFLLFSRSAHFESINVGLKRNFLSLSLSLVVGSLAISLSAYSCTHMHRSWMRTAFLASWQCARVHTWITSRWFYLFCFFHLFPRNLAGLSRRWYDARQVVAPSNRFASLFLRVELWLSRFSRNYFRRIVRYYLSYSMIIDWFLL